ncbi:MAG TPA: PucR family transcriptional regulator ligand-binding domain-containing protein [Jatrophihabitans sp.]|nr:PucR family transcriptional regulator ligand-binding domain-containing protein [Jatrophihabitans sp.]
MLRLPAVQRGEPVVRAGAAHLDRTVRWVHVSEVSDIAHLLEGGELILTTGIALPDSPAELAGYADALAGVGVSAVAVELGRRYRSALPDELVAAAEQAGLPLIELRRETPFVGVTQAVHTLILDARMQELIASDEAHRAFTELSVAGHGPQQVVDLVAQMSGRPVVYENLAHQVLAYRCEDAALVGWEARSRAAADVLPEGWLAVGVGAPGGTEFGRLVMLGDGDPTPRQRMLLERGASALVINRLTVRDLDSLDRQTHRTLLTALVMSTNDAAETAARAKALGVPLERRRLTGVVVRAAAEHGRLPALLRDVASSAVTALKALRVPALVGPLDDRRVAVLLSQDRSADVDSALAKLSARLHAVGDRRPDVSIVVAAGSTVAALERAHHTLREAMQVADTAVGLPPTRTYFRPADLRLRGLVYALREEPVVRDYVERELGQLLAHDAAHGSRLYEFLAAFCRTGANKTAAADQLFISRAALYDRIAKVEKVLGVDLADPEVILSLHFAVLARETMRRPDLAVLTG